MIKKTRICKKIWSMDRRFLHHPTKSKCKDKNYSKRARGERNSKNMNFQFCREKASFYFLTWSKQWTAEMNLRGQMRLSPHERGWPQYPQSTAATWNNPLKDSESGSFCLNLKCFSREPQNNRSLPSNYNGQTHRPRVHFQDKTFQWLPRGYPYSSSHITGKVPIGMGADSC